MGQKLAAARLKAKRAGSNEDEYALFLAISEIGRRAAATPPNNDPANTSFAIVEPPFEPAAVAAEASPTEGP